MNQAKVNEMVAEMRDRGHTDEMIRKVLFNTKGVRVSQIQKALG